MRVVLTAAQCIKVLTYYEQSGVTGIVVDRAQTLVYYRAVGRVDELDVVSVE